MLIQRNIPLYQHKKGQVYFLSIESALSHIADIHSTENQVNFHDFKSHADLYALLLLSFEGQNTTEKT